MNIDLHKEFFALNYLTWLLPLSENNFGNCDENSQSSDALWNWQQKILLIKR